MDARRQRMDERGSTPRMQWENGISTTPLDSGEHGICAARKGIKMSKSDTFRAGGSHVIAAPKGTEFMRENKVRRKFGWCGSCKCGCHLACTKVRFNVMKTGNLACECPCRLADMDPDL